jgi:hypothetical protein
LSGRKYGDLNTQSGSLELGETNTEYIVVGVRLRFAEIACNV